MNAGDGAPPDQTAERRETAVSGRAADRRAPSLGVSVPTRRGRWFVAFKWGRDRRARPRRDDASHPPPTAVDHPLSRLGLVAVSTSIAIAVVSVGTLIYALILE